MPIFRLGKEPIFPPVELAEENGLLAVGGDLSPERLINAYSEGIFPWYSPGEPILWWSPDPRLILDPHQLHIPRSLAKVIRRGRYHVTFNRDFAGVIAGCGQTRPDGTWITREMQTAYLRLHQLEVAHSAEAWQEGEEGPELVGGVYGVALGGCFFGESMFFRQPDASKVAFVALVERLRESGFILIDCQMTTHHLIRFGAHEVTRGNFLARLGQALEMQHPPRSFLLGRGPGGARPLAREESPSPRSRAG